MTFYVLSLIALAVLFGTASKLLHRYVLKETEPYAYALLINLVSTLLFLPLAARHVTLPSNSTGYILLGIAALLWTIVSVSGNFAYKGTDVSIKDPISQSALLWTLVFGIAFLGENPSPLRITGTLIIFLGVSGLMFHPEKRFGRMTNPGIQWTLFTALLGAGVAIVDKFMLKSFPPEFYGFLMFLGPTVTLSLFLGGRSQHLVHLLRRRGLAAIAASILTSAMYYLTLKTYAVIDVTLAYPLLRLGTLFTVLSGIVILKEREHLTQKVIATIIIVTGSILVGF